MFDKINLENPVVLSSIGFIVIFAYQYYQRRIQNKKDDDDYSNDADLPSLMYVPLLTAVLIWMSLNFLNESRKGVNLSTLIPTKQPIGNINNLASIPTQIPQSMPKAISQQPLNNINSNTNMIGLRDVFTNQPNF